MASDPLSEGEVREVSSFDTKQRLLEAAIRVFSEKGFQASSMRTITREAGTSLSAANYHFGSKEELLRAALAARVELLNARRIELLDEAYRGQEGPVTVEAVLDGFIRPIFERQADVRARGDVPPGLAIRLYLDPPDVVSRIWHDMFETTNQRFVQALGAALPGSTEASAMEALRCVLGIVIYAVSEWNESIQERPADRMDERARLERLVTFASAGVRALVSGMPSSPSSDEGVVS